MIMVRALKGIGHLFDLVQLAVEAPALLIVVIVVSMLLAIVMGNKKIENNT
jgi:hypothetical protein